MIIRDLIVDRDRWLFRAPTPWDARYIRQVLNADTVNESSYAVIIAAAHPSSAAAVKLIRPRSQPRDTIRKYYRCQAFREYDAAHRLAQWSIPSIPVHGWGVALAPNAPYESMLLMDYKPGHSNARRYLEDETDSHAQWQLLNAIAEDVATIYMHGYHHNDCHLGNIIVDQTGNRTWVDNELRRIRGRDSLLRRFDQTLGLLDRSVKQAVSPRMKHAFLTRCRVLVNEAHPR